MDANQGNWICRTCATVILRFNNRRHVVLTQIESIRDAEVGSNARRRRRPDVRPLANPT
jgi:hypothetical protein